MGNVAELAQQEFSDRLKSIQKLEATYHLDVQATPRHEDCGEFTIAGHKIVIGPSETHTTGYFSFLSGRALSVVEPSPGDIEAAKRSGTDLVTVERMFTDERVETNVVHTAATRPVGTIEDNAKIPDDLVIDVALGFRMFGGSTWLTLGDLKGFIASSNDPHYGVIEKQDPSGYIHNWKVEVDGKGSLVSYALLTKARKEFLRYDLSDFMNISGISLPKKIIVTRKLLADGPDGKDSVSWTTETGRLIVDKYIIGGPQNVAAKYQMVWPKGGAVLDARIGRQFNIVTGARTLTDQEIFQLLGRQENAASQPTTQQVPK